MRLKITLHPQTNNCQIPINYQYPLSGMIYRTLREASPEYASWLHHQGYVGQDGKIRKLFVFSKIYSKKPMKRIDQTLVILNQDPCTLYLSSPMLENFVSNFVTGLFLKREIEIASKGTVGKFRIEGVESMPNPDWKTLFTVSPKLQFECLSAITLSKSNPDKNKPSHYLRPDEADLPLAIRRNLIEKYSTMTGNKPKEDQLEFEFDRDYIQKRGGYEKISKLIWIKEGDYLQETKIKSFIAPFTLKGSAELIQCAYECGIGEKNSLGFGMINLLESEKNKKSA